MKLCFKNEQIVKCAKERKVMAFSLQKNRKYGTIKIRLNENLGFQLLYMENNGFLFLVLKSAIHDETKDVK